MSVSESYIRKTVAPEASLAVAGCHQELPVRKGTLGPDVIDITTLYAETGRVTYDPSFTSTASCESKITFNDSPAGSASTRTVRTRASTIAWMSNQRLLVEQ